MQGGTAMKLAEAFAPLVDLIYPPRFPSCGEAIAAQDGLCAVCWSELVVPSEAACTACQRPFGDTVVTGSVCAPCLAKPPQHDGIAAGTIYNEASRKLVLAFKHGRRIALASMLGRMIAARLPTLQGEWLIVPVPLHRWRLWRRGFNQSGLLAQEIGRLIAQPVLIDGLRRRKHTRTLGRLGRPARARMLSGAIGLNDRHRSRINGARILLVDDVMTSGATSDACARVLKRAGAEQVIVACFARVLDEAL